MEKQSLILNIIPILPLPPVSPDVFSYYANFDVPKDSLVEIKFRNKIALGYVQKVIKPQQFRYHYKEMKLEIKPIIRLVSTKALFLAYQHRLANWLKNFYFLSLAKSYFLLLPYPRELISLNVQAKTKLGSGHRIIWLKNFEDFKNLKNKKILFIVPTENLIETFYNKLNSYNQTTLFLSRFSPKKRLFLLEEILNNDNLWVIGPKNLIFLPWQNLEGIVILNEGSFLYKEYFKAPFFDYRTIARKISLLLNIPLFIFDNVPSFTSLKSLSHKTFKIPSGKEILRLSPEEIFEENFLKKFDRVIYFGPQKLTAHRIICSNCNNFSPRCPDCSEYLWLENENLFCPLCLKKIALKICPTCKKEISFNLKYLGLSGLVKYLKSIGRKVHFIKTERDLKKYPDGDIVGSFLLLEQEWPDIENFVFFNFDQFFYTRDLFLREKFIRILNHFREKNIFVISSLKESENILKSFKDGTIWKNLYEERYAEKMPPFYRLVRVIFSLSNLKSLQDKSSEARKIIEKRLSKNDIIIGPIFTYPERQRKKFFLQLLLKTKTSNLAKLLQGINFNNYDAEADKLF